MSQVRLDKIWQPQAVLPYILKDLRAKVEAITPVHAIYLFGSRGRIPIAKWNTLDGKDWDVLMVADFPITNTHVWTHQGNYYVDLKVTSSKLFKARPNKQKLLELYPQLPDALKEYLNNIKT